VTRVTLRTEAAIKIGSGMALPIHRAPICRGFLCVTSQGKGVAATIIAAV
jgi:hypothetical protein